MSPNDDRAMSQLISTIFRTAAAFAIVRRIHVLPVLWILLAHSFCSGCQSFQKRTSLRSAQCGALCARAREAHEQGNRDQANQLIDEALLTKPNDIETRRQLAEAMWKNGRRGEAIVEFTALCVLQPKDSKLSARLAVMQWESNQHAAAANTALSVLKLDPQSKDAWLIKARNEAAQGQLDDALASFIRLSQIAPDDLSTLIDLGKLHLKRGHPDRACPLFRTAVEHPRASQEQRAEAEWLLGVAYVQSNRWSDAVVVLERAINGRSASAEDWCMLGSARMECGDVSGAQSDVQRALQRDPKSIGARNLARQLELRQVFESSDRFITPASHQENP